jgi:hypothetical protein
MDAGDQEGTLTTRPVRFDGSHMFVNLDARNGELRAALLDDKGQEIEPFTRERCVPIRADKTLQPVTWSKEASLARLAGQRVRFRFFLQRGQLYSFWVSQTKSGASKGYVAAGGPGFMGPTDKMTNVE